MVELLCGSQPKAVRGSAVRMREVLALELVVFSLCLFPLVVSHVVVLLNFAHELLFTTRVRQPEDFRRNKLILIILPTQDKKKNIYYKVCPGEVTV